MVALSHNFLSTFLSHGIDGFIEPHTDQNPQDLLNWFKDPTTQAAINTLKLIAEAAASLRQSRASFNAIATLDNICTQSPDPIQRRLAATRLLNGAPPLRAGPSSPTPPPLDTPEPSSLPAEFSSDPFVARPPDPEPQPALASSTPDAVAPLPTQPVTHDPDDARDNTEDDPAHHDADEDREADAFASQFEEHVGVPLHHPEILKAVVTLAESQMAGAISDDTDDLDPKTIAAASCLSVHPRILHELERLAGDIRARSP